MSVTGITPPRCCRFSSDALLSSCGSSASGAALTEVETSLGRTPQCLPVTVHPVGELCTRDADLFGVPPLPPMLLSVRLCLHCLHRFPVSAGVLANEM